MNAGIRLEKLDNPPGIKAILSRRAIQDMNLQERLARGEEIELILTPGESEVQLGEAGDKEMGGMRSVLRLRLDGAAEAVFLCDTNDEDKPAKCQEFKLGNDEISEHLAMHFRDRQGMEIFLAAVYQDELPKPHVADPVLRKRAKAVEETPALALCFDLLCFANLVDQTARNEPGPDGFSRSSVKGREARSLGEALKPLRKLVQMPLGPAIIKTLVKVTYGRADPRWKRRAKFYLQVLKGREAAELAKELESFFAAHDGN